MGEVSLLPLTKRANESMVSEVCELVTTCHVCIALQACCSWKLAQKRKSSKIKPRRAEIL